MWYQFFKLVLFKSPEQNQTLNFLFLWAVPVYKQWKPFQSQCQCVFSYFWVWVVSSDFLKFKFKFKIWQTFILCKFVHFQGVSPIIFVFTNGTISARDSCQQYPFMHNCNSTLNTLSSLSSIANQTAGLPLFQLFLVLALNLTL